MPPKRKQVDDSTAETSTSTRATRASARATNAKSTAAASGTKKTTRGGAKAAATSAPGEESDATESVHSAKKARTAPAKKTAVKGGRKKGGQDDAESTETPRKHPSTKELPPKASNPEPVSLPISEATSQAPAKPPAQAKKTSKPEPYTPQRALELFHTYAGGVDSDIIGPEGFEQLCADADMPMEGARPLIFAWQMQAKEMAKISKEEWVEGMATLKIASTAGLSIAMAELDDLLFHDKRTTKASGKEYDRATYQSYASNSKAAFQKLYMFSFNLVKPEQSKNIDMETSVAFWTVLLVPKFPLMAEIVEFINEKEGAFKATNKDLWSMMLEFCETVKPTLQDYEADGAWPTLLDDFVSWKSSKMGNGKADDKMDED